MQYILNSLYTSDKTLYEFEETMVFHSYSEMHATIFNFVYNFYKVKKVLVTHVNIGELVVKVSNNRAVMKFLLRYEESSEGIDSLWLNYMIFEYSISKSIVPLSSFNEDVYTVCPLSIDSINRYSASYKYEHQEKYKEPKQVAFI